MPPLDLAPIRARAEAATPTVQQIESLLREHANALMEEARFETLATSERVADTADPLCREIRSLAHQHAAANDDRVALLAEVAQLAEEVERLRGRVACAYCFVLDDGNYAIERRIGDRWIVVDEVAGRYLYAGVGWVDFHDSADDDDGWLFPTLDAAWAALDAARKEGAK